MESVFSQFYYEPIRYNPDDGRHETINGHDVYTVTGTGAVSGRDYSLVLVDGALDERRTRKY